MYICSNKWFPLHQESTLSLFYHLVDLYWKIKVFVFTTYRFNAFLNQYIKRALYVSRFIQKYWIIKMIIKVILSYSKVKFV